MHIITDRCLSTEDLFFNKRVICENLLILSGLFLGISYKNSRVLLNPVTCQNKLRLTEVISHFTFNHVFTEPSCDMFVVAKTDFGS